MNRAAIFDMDGLLIDSEPAWRAAERRVFSSVGIDLNDADCRQTTGLRVDKVVEYWFQRYPWNGTSQTAIAAEIVATVRNEILDSGVPMPGVVDILKLFSGSGWKIGLASSSPIELIAAVVRRLGISDYFGALCSAFDEPFSKPHPGVYLTTAQRLGVQPSRCIAFEDSKTGVAAAKSAEMFVVAVPDETYRQSGEMMAGADLQLTSLEQFSLAHLAVLGSE
jgi:sugar-phosphatase